MTNAVHHHIAVQSTVGSLQLKVDINLTANWTVLFGPSGSGKSSILRAICGLLPNTNIPSPGPINGGGEKPALFLPPYRRNLAYAPQGAVLFPHLSVRENIAFALTSRRLPPNIDPLLDLFALTSLAKRRPRDLSGGERQRVSLARACAVPNPHLILLDEPFTGLDRALRDSLLPRIKQHLAERNIPALSVTHDIEEALLLDAEVIRIESGKVIAQGPAHQVLAQERIQLLKTLTPNP